MSLTAGTRLGACEVIAKLGEGAMGEVYRATDTKLKRQVAIKVLPSSFAADHDRVARFRREAEVLASLNHPHIAGIYGFEESDQVSAIVMELVDGEDLSQRISRGAIPIDEALPIAKQIAEALEAAHEQGIIHRDLKPANVKLRGDGTVKVLDFGLAKALDPGSAGGGQGSAHLANSPTITSPAMTMHGVILGTAAYMAPEQAKGKTVDRRADIWAFGVVLHEMLTGQHLFTADTVPETLAHVMTRAADLGSLPETTPRRVRELIARCLEKDPKKRLRDIGEARLILEDPAALAAGTSPAPVTGSAPTPRWYRLLPWAVAGVAVLALGVLLSLWAPWRAVPVAAPRKLLVSIGVDAAIDRVNGASTILSPDGSVLVVAARPTGSDRTQLFARKLDQLQAVPLAGTEDVQNPFFSADGQWIGFFAGGKLKKVSITGGAPVALADAPFGRGGTWTEDETIIFTPTNSLLAGMDQAPVPLHRVSASGGQPSVFGTMSPGAVTQRWPQVLPGGKAVLYTEHVGGRQFETANLAVVPLAGGEPKIVVRGAYYGRYVPSGHRSRTYSGEVGHLLYMHNNALFAAPFDLDRLETRGPAVPALEGISTTPESPGGAQIAFAADGTVVYAPESAATDVFSLDWMTRDGKTSPLRGAKVRWADPKFSPDGQRVAMAIYDGRQYDLWVYEWARDALTQLTFDPGDDRNPVWTPDGKRIAFNSDRAKAGFSNLYWVNADGTGEPERLTDSPRSEVPTSWHPSGKFLAFHTGRPMLLPMNRNSAGGWTPGNPTALLPETESGTNPSFSPDGRFIAYTTQSRANRSSLYVRSFPGNVGTWRITIDAASQPAWSTTSPELLFLSGNTVMVTTYSVAGDAFKADKPQPWSPTPYRSVGAGFGSYALHPDGKRVAIAVVPEDHSQMRDKVVLMTNFFDYLNAIAPIKD